MTNNNINAEEEHQAEISSSTTITTTNSVTLFDDVPCRSNATSPTDTLFTDFESTTIPSTNSQILDAKNLEVIDSFEEKVRKRRSTKSVSLTSALQDLRRKSITLLDLTSWRVSMEQFQSSFELYCFVFEDFVSRKDGRRVFQEYLKQIARNDELFLFYEEIECYEHYKSDKERYRQAQKILNKYIAEESDFEINIASDSKKSVYDAWEKSSETNCSQTLFAALKQYVFLELKRDLFVRFNNSQQIKDFLFSKVSALKNVESVFTYYGGIKKSQSFIYKLRPQESMGTSTLSKSTTADFEEMDAASVEEEDTGSMESMSQPQHRKSASVAKLTTLEQPIDLKRRVKSDVRKSLTLAKRLPLFRKSNPVVANFDELHIQHSDSIFDLKEFAEVLEDCKSETNKWMFTGKNETVTNYCSIVNYTLTEESQNIPKVQKLKTVGSIPYSYHEVIKCITQQHFYTCQDSNLKKTHVLSVGKENDQAHLITLEKFKYRWPLNKRYCIKYCTIQFDSLAERYIILFKPCLNDKYDYSMKKKSKYIKMYHKGAFVVEKQDENSSKVYSIQSYYFGGQSKTTQQILKKKSCPLEALKKCMEDRHHCHDETLFSQRMREMLFYNHKQSDLLGTC